MQIRWTDHPRKVFKRCDGQPTKPHVPDTDIANLHQALDQLRLVFDPLRSPHVDSVANTGNLSNP
jgi:hypothetical protein